MNEQPGSRRFTLAFAALVAALFTAQVLAPVQAHVVAPFTRAVAAMTGFALSVLDPQVRYAGALIGHASGAFAIEVVSGCNGLEPILVLLAAVIAYPARAWQRAAGFAAGVIAVQAMNAVRVASLYYLGQWHGGAFDFAHLYAWPVLVMVDALLVWLAWLAWVGRGEARP